MEPLVIQREFSRVPTTRSVTTGSDWFLEVCRCVGRSYKAPKPTVRFQKAGKRGIKVVYDELLPPDVPSMRVEWSMNGPHRLDEAGGLR